MKLLKSGGFILILFLAIAGAVRILYPPMPQPIRTLVSVASEAENAHLILETRLPLFKTAQFQAIGLPDEEPATLELVRAYVDDLQKTPEKVDIVVSASSKITDALPNVQRGTAKVDPKDLEPLITSLRSLQAQNLRVLLIFSSIHATHRMGMTVVRTLEDRLGLQIPVIIFSGLALSEDTEAALIPPCIGNPFSEGGQVFDLACNILTLSKKAQVEKPPLDHYLVSIEEEAADEELVAIYRPHH